MAQLIDLTKNLHDAIERSHKMAEPMLSQRQRMLKEYASGFYSKSGPDSRKPLNMVYRGLSILVPLLVSRAPRTMVRARSIQLKPFADTLRMTLNYFAKNIDLDTVIRESVVNSLLYMGITKTGLTDSNQYVKDIYGYEYDPGEVFVENVDPSDYVWDVVARSKGDMDFEGNRYRVPLEYLRESDDFENVDRLQPKYATYSSQRTAEDIAKSAAGSFEINEMQEYAEVYDIWMPSEGVVLTLPQPGEGDKPLREVEWDGPESGPYDILKFSTFPESIVPVPPVYAWLDLHDYINTMARKMGRRANREKNILIYSGVAEEDARNIVEAEDNEAVRVDDADAFQNLQMGGINDDSYTYIGWLKQMWSEMAGNADLVGGLRPQAETLGQEQMLYANATVGLEDMNRAVQKFTESILRKVAWYVWTDPLININVTKRVKGYGDFEVKFSQEAKEGDFLDYNIELEPYSMREMSPTMRMRRIMELVSGIILPTADISAQQGNQLDIAQLVKLVGRDLDLTESEIDSIYKTVDAQTQGQDMGPYQPEQGSVIMGTTGMSDDSQGASGASREANSRQQQVRAGLRSSPPNQRSEP